MGAITTSLESGGYRGHGPLQQVARWLSRAWPAPTGSPVVIAGMARSNRYPGGHRGRGPLLQEIVGAPHGRDYHAAIAGVSHAL